MESLATCGSTPTTAFAICRGRSYPKNIANIKDAERNMVGGEPAALRTFSQQHAWTVSELSRGPLTHCAVRETTAGNAGRMALRPPLRG